MDTKKKTIKTKSQSKVAIKTQIVVTAMMLLAVIVFYFFVYSAINSVLPEIKPRNLLTEQARELIELKEKINDISK